MSCTLYKVPSEMREAIILLALPDEWNGKTPEIIKALRIDRKLHAEAMQAFNKMGYAYVLRRENDWGFGDMKESAISMIRKVKIIIDGPREGEPSAQTQPNLRVSLRHLKRLPESIQATKYVDQVDIEYAPCNGDLHYCALQRHIWQFSAGFKALKRFTVLPPWLAPSSAEGYAGRYVVRYVEEANKIFGSLGKMTTVYAGEQIPFNRSDTYIWVAEEGKFLTTPENW